MSQRSRSSSHRRAGVGGGPLLGHHPLYYLLHLSAPFSPHCTPKENLSQLTLIISRVILNVKVIFLTGLFSEKQRNL